MSFENICWYLGNWSLYGLIGFGALALLIAALRKSWYWFTAIAICFAGVIGAEIWSFIHLGISISTQSGRWQLKIRWVGHSLLALIWRCSGYRFT